MPKFDAKKFWLFIEPIAQMLVASTATQWDDRVLSVLKQAVDEGWLDSLLNYSHASSGAEAGARSVAAPPEKLIAATTDRKLDPALVVSFAQALSEISERSKTGAA